MLMSTNRSHHERERDKPHSYRHEPSAPVRDYSLLIMETMEMSLGEMEMILL